MATPTILGSVQNLMTHIKAIIDRQRSTEYLTGCTDIQEYVYDHELELKASYPIAMEMLGYMPIDDKRDMYAQVDEYGGQSVTVDYLKVV